MTSMVIPMILSVDRELINRLFSKFSNKYGKLWTTRLGENGDWDGCVQDWLEELSQFSFDHVRAAVNQALSIYEDFPPTLPQLLKLCRNLSGFPQQPDILSQLKDRNFTHPITKLVYDKIGSWKLSNGKEEEIKSLVKEHYPLCMAAYLAEPEKQHNILRIYNTKHKELPSPDKIPTPGERKGFKERLAEYQLLSMQEKELQKDHPAQTFDHDKIKIGHRDFDKQVYEEYRDYLLNVPETKVLTLSRNDAYMRMRFISLKEQPDDLRKQGYVPQHMRETKEPIKSSIKASRPTHIYQAWTNE